jgi:hypothetical protein
MTATGNMTFRRLDEEPLEQDEAIAPSPTSSDLGARFWYAFDRWLAVTTQQEEDFVLA